MWELDEIYIQVIRQSLGKVYDEQDKPQLAKMFRQVVGSIVVLYEPLSAADLARLLAVREHIVSLRLRYLHSILEIPEGGVSPIRLFHPSFRDFLLDKQRCRDQYFWVD
jgi:hypothetical protein